MNSMTRRGFMKSGLTASALAAAGGSNWAQGRQIEEIPAANVEPQVVTTEDGVPRAAAIAIADLLDHGARIRSGQKVLILAYLDGLYGGDNLVDREAIHWIQRAAETRGARTEILWADVPARVHEWQFPTEIRAAMDRSDLVINHSFDLVVEEILSFRQYVEQERKIPMVRNFATTASLLSTEWAQTPQELVSEIRYQAALLVQPGLKWQLSDPNGTHLEGIVVPARNPSRRYAVRREEGRYLPWPEWVCPPIALGQTSGTFIFDRMLSWWSRYIGVRPYFDKPVRLTVRDNRILGIEGGTEAEALRSFLTDLHGRLGESAYDFDTLHFGVHPQAQVAAHQCPSILYRRMIEHSHSSNLHVHIGSPKAAPSYPYWPHITGDVRQATFRIGDTLIHDAGRLTVLDARPVRAVAARYPGRPGLSPEPCHG